MSNISPVPVVICVVLALLAPCAADEFLQLPNTEKTADETRLVPAAAAKQFQFPPDFQVQVFAAEPDIQNPIGAAWDSQGRLWVAENYTYAERPQRFDLSLRDRVVILEDTDGDGKADKRSIFVDDVKMLTSVEIGYGGVWLMCPPQLLFLPDHDGDDRPDGPPVVVLDGFKVSDGSSHNFANGLRFGPDGWLYGRCGHSCPGEIGKPGTPDDQRYPVRGGIWRYHPKLKHVEVLTSGTVNPWGHDWTAEGEMFFTNTVIGHLWHMLPGAHYVRREPRDPYAHVYEMIDQHADHYHFDTGQDWSASREGKANSWGGGHAHSGAMIYLADNWPADYRGRFFTLNFHGRRINQEILARRGSGYVGHHGEDIGLSADPWFRGIDLMYGPDGGVFVLDWSDAGECHEHDGVHRTSGRIFKIDYRQQSNSGASREPLDLRRMTAAELVGLHTHGNEWYVRQSRLALATMAHAGNLNADIPATIRNSFEQSKNPLHQLRLMLLLHAVGKTDNDFLTKQLHHPNEHVRAWAIRCLTDTWPIDGPLGPISILPGQRAAVNRAADELLPKLIQMAAEDVSSLVRLSLASTLQRLPVGQRVELAAALAGHEQDAEDHNLPLLVWYGLIPASPESLVEVFHKCDWPKLRQFIARRLAEQLEKDAKPLNALLATSQTAGTRESRRDLLLGIQVGTRGWPNTEPPSNWPSFKEMLVGGGGDIALLLKAEQVGVVFGDAESLASLERFAGDSSIDSAIRQEALQSVIDQKPARLRAFCRRLLADQQVGMIAARGLATFNDPQAADDLIAAYGSFGPNERQGMLSLLVSRHVFADRLLTAIAEQRVARDDLTAYHVRQIHSLKHHELSKRATEVWGAVNDTPRAKQQAIQRWRELLTPEQLSQTNFERGKQLFVKSCAQCHRLYGEGGEIGTDLTGSNRNNLNYLLENIIHPSAEVSADYRMTVLTLQDGRVLNGLIAAETDRTVTLQSPTEAFVVPRESIEAVDKTNVSPMPEGLLDPLSQEQVRDLIGFLMSQENNPSR